jgi:hypothetical protein
LERSKIGGSVAAWSRLFLIGSGGDMLLIL